MDRGAEEEIQTAQNREVDVMDLPLSAIIPALVVVVVVLALEDWAYLKSKSKLQRAFITGIAVFLLVLVINIPLAYW